MNGKKLSAVCAMEQGGGPRDGEFDNIVFGNVDTAAEVERHLTGRTVTNVHRLGKNLWIELDGKGPCPTFHFGMTGSFVVKGGCVLLCCHSVSLPDVVPVLVHTGMQ